jgi:predicted lipoprotein with Yx(FWY)xxD motif
MTTSLGTVLTNASGLTLYWFAKDTSTTSACSGPCAANWPPVSGTPQAGTGVTLPGTLGTIMRPGGTAQATYNGHPLYTFVGDTSPGQTSGNGVNGYGGLWYAVKVTSSAGSSPTPANPAPATSSSGGGYGY